MRLPLRSELAPLNLPACAWGSLDVVAQGRRPSYPLGGSSSWPRPPPFPLQLMLQPEAPAR